MNNNISDYLKNPSYTKIDGQEMMMDLYLGNKLQERKDDFFMISKKDKSWKRGELDHLPSTIKETRIQEGFTNKDQLAKIIQDDIKKLRVRIEKHNKNIEEFNEKFNQYRNNTLKYVNAKNSPFSGKNIQLSNGTRYYVNQYGVAREWGNQWNSKHFSCSNTINRVNESSLSQLALIPGPKMTPTEPCGFEGKNIRVGNIEKENVLLDVQSKCGIERITITSYYGGRPKVVLRNHRLSRNKSRIQVPLFDDKRRNTMLKIDISNASSGGCGIIISNIRIIANDYQLDGRVTSSIFDRHKDRRTGVLSSTIRSQLSRGELNENGSYFISLQHDDKYEGCFNENIRNRVINRNLGKMTKEQCSVVSNIGGFKHYALQNYEPKLLNEYDNRRYILHPSALLSTALLNENNAIQQCNSRNDCVGIANVRGNQYALLRNMRRGARTNVLFSRQINRINFRAIRRTLQNGVITRTNQYGLVINGIGRSWRVKIKRRWRRSKRVTRRATNIDVIYQSNPIDMTFIDRIQFRWNLQRSNPSTIVNVRIGNINYTRNSISSSHTFDVSNLVGNQTITLRVLLNSGSIDTLQFRLQDIMAIQGERDVKRRRELTLLGKGDCYVTNNEDVARYGRSNNCKRRLDNNVYGQRNTNAVYSHIMDDELQSGTGYVTMDNKLRMYPNNNVDNNTGSCPTDITDTQWNIFNSFIKGENMKPNSLCGLEKLNQGLRKELEERRKHLMRESKNIQGEINRIRSENAELSEFPKVMDLMEGFNSNISFDDFDNTEDINKDLEEFEELVRKFRDYEQKATTLDAMAEHYIEERSMNYTSYVIWILIILAIGGGIYAIKRQ